MDISKRKRYAPSVTFPPQSRPVHRTGSRPGALGDAGVTASASVCSTLRGPAREMCYALYGG